MSDNSMRITIQHTGAGPEEPLFRLNLADNPTEPVRLPNPASYPVEGYDGGLTAHLQWYLEDYLSLPEGGNKKRAEAVVSTLEAWGAAVFDALFADRNTYLWYHENLKKLSDLQIRIISSSPAVLAWPWEALCDNHQPGARTGTFLAPHCCLERQPDTLVPSPTPAGESEELRLLLVIARPYGQRDVGYHALAREMVDFVEENHLPVSIDVLRPPTFENLRKILTRANEEGRPYHIVHFDGHGGYGMPDEKQNAPDRDRRQKFQSAAGSLVFETVPKPGADPEPDVVGAKELGQVLFQCGVRMAVLNACQSAMIDGRAEDTYASVAASLLKAGILSVTAMGYSLYVTGAQQFVPAFYEELFRRGAPADAMRAGRNAMYIHKERYSLTGETPLQDWLVPELYQKVPAGARVLPVTKQRHYEPEAENIYPPDALEQDAGGFIGRGQAILELERLIQRKTAAGILIHGMAGAGKTTLAKGFLAWLRDTGGLRETDGTLCPVIWFDFREVFSGTYIVDHLAARLCEGGASPKNEENLRRVVSFLKRRRAFIVWDNFESASGAVGTTANLSEKERQYLKDFLEKLRGGRTKVLITSRTGEDWLTGGTDRICAHMKRDLDGLRGDELWDYCGQIAEELGVTLDEDAKRDGADLAKLLDRLDGNPLAVRSVLLRLKDTKASDLLAQLDRAFTGAAGDESTQRILAAFDVLMRGADADMVPVLQTLGLHEHYADVDYVASIVINVLGIKAKSPEGQQLYQTVKRCFALLESAGLCTHMGNNIYRVHPALRGCLAERYAPTEDVKRWFAVYMDHVENRYRNDGEQRRAFFSIHEANIRHAQEIAEKIAKTPDLQKVDMSLTASLASNADDRGDFGQAEALYLQLADKARRYGSPREEDRAYSQLASLAYQRGERDAEKQWAQKAADVWKNAENLSADVLYSLGNNAYSQGNYATAMEYWEQAAVLWEREGNSRAVAVYGMLGNTAMMMNDGAAARKWLRKNWEAAEKRGDVSHMAAASASLAALAEKQGDLGEAEKWYHQSIALFKHLEHDQMISVSRYALGDLYIQMGRPGRARAEFTEAVNIAKRLNLKPNIADCYDGLGDAARLEGAFTEARDWYEEELKLCEELKDELRLSRVRISLQQLEKRQATKSGDMDGLPGGLMQMLDGMDPEDLKKLLDGIDLNKLLDDNQEGDE